SDDTLSALKKQKTFSTSSLTTIDSYYTCPLPHEKINLIHESLVKFFITCGISFRIVENKYFHDFLGLLNLNLTLMFDGWTTILNNSVYAFLAVTSYREIHVLGLEEFENQHHTRENIADMAIEVIKKIRLDIEQFNREISADKDPSKLEENYYIDDWDNDTSTSTELESELEIFFEEEKIEHEAIVDSALEFIIEQLIDINNLFFSNQTISNNFIDESLVIDKDNNDNNWDIDDYG
ncbi:12460_t:CDS:2, partial [Racocetra fulgida]